MATEGPKPRRSTRISATPLDLSVQVASDRKRSTKQAMIGNEDSEGFSRKKAKPIQEKADDVVENEIKTSKIDIGDSLPAISLKNEKGEDVNVAELAAQRGVVMFLVPKADTPGCTAQACGFRDSFPDYTALDFDVYCLSADASAAQTKWQRKKSLPYSLLSDPKRVLIGALGAADHNKTKRSHFIFEKGGKLVDKKIPVKPVDSPRLALEFIKGSKHD